VAEQDPSSTDSAVGALAYASELWRLSSNLINDPPARHGLVGRAIDRARAIAAGGDFIRAVHVLGNVHLEAPPTVMLLTRRGAPDPEASLARLREAILDAPDGPQRVAAERLLRAARLEISQRHWFAVRALIGEAEDRLASEEFVRPLER
jgi:hypothetical protein